jgi:hypothetical protein
MQRLPLRKAARAMLSAGRAGALFAPGQASPCMEEQETQPSRESLVDVSPDNASMLLDDFSCLS